MIKNKKKPFATSSQVKNTFKYVDLCMYGQSLQPRHTFMDVNIDLQQDANPAKWATLKKQDLIRICLKACKKLIQL